MEQGGKAFLRVDQGGFPLALAGYLADYPDHLRPALAIMGQAAVDFQPVQAAIRPADAMAHGFLGRFTVDHCLEQLACAGAIFFRQQVQVVDVVGQGALRIETEQCLGAARPADPATVDVPQPGAQAGTIERSQQLRSVLPGQFRLLGVGRRDARQARKAVC
ncbi:hypothetical protein D3C81_1576370 [compost metagenome]